MLLDSPRVTRRLARSSHPTHSVHPARSRLSSLVFLACLSLAGIHSSDAFAQEAVTKSAVKRYDIPAGSLDQVLNQFSVSAGILLSMDASLTAGKSSQGLSGSYDVQDAFSRLLANTGLESVVRGNNQYVLRLAAGKPQIDSALPVVTVEGSADAVTEGSGSYLAKGPSAAATRLNLTTRETPQSISVITRQQMDDQRLSSVLDVLQNTVGVTNFSQGLGTDLQQLYARGFSISNYLIDGVPTVSNTNAVRQDTAMFDRVEVVRGATGLMKGLGDPGAAINLVRKRPTAEPQSIIEVEAGSWSRYGAMLDLSRPLNESGSVRGRLVADFKDQQSWVDRFKSKTALVYGIAEFDVGRDTMLTAGFNYQKNDNDAPMRTGAPIYYSDGTRINLPRSYNNAPDWTFYNTEQASVFAALDHRFDNGWRAKMEVNQTRTKLDALSYYHSGSGDIDPVTGLGSAITPSRWQDEIRTNSLDVYLSGPFSLLGRKHELVAGIGLSESNADTPSYGVGGWLWSWASSYDGTLGDVRTWNGSGLPVPEFISNGNSQTKETTASAYLTARFNLADSTNLIVGTRVVDWKRTVDSVSNGVQSRTEQKENGVIVPYAGLVYAFNDNWSVYGSYSKIFNPQSASVRDINNKPLDPQEGSGYEVGVKAGFLDNRLNASFALFKIQQDKVAELNLLTNAYEMREGINTEGAELEVSGELADGWNVVGGYTYTLSHDKDNKRVMQRIPLNTVKAFTTYRMRGALEKLTIGGGVTWQTRSGWEGGEYPFQQAYGVVRAMARYDVNKHMTLSLNINNLFDKRYYSALLDNGIYGEPRNFMLSMKYKF